MKRASYKEAVSFTSRWTSDWEEGEELKEYVIAVKLIAEIFGLPVRKVAKDVRKHRKEWMDEYMEFQATYKEKKSKGKGK